MLKQKLTVHLTVSGTDDEPVMQFDVVKPPMRLIPETMIAFIREAGPRNERYWHIH